MAQFDVYANPTVASRDGFPYFVVLQRDQPDHLPTRWVMPLQRLAQAPSEMPRRLAQRVLIKGESLHPAAHQGSLRDALDAVISGV